MRDRPGIFRDLAYIGFSGPSSKLFPDILSCVNLGALAAVSNERWKHGAPQLHALMSKSSSP